jgi:predicted nuclease of restriction endonuclease-like (RecB) superfamily
MLFIDMTDSLEALHRQLSSHAARQADQFMTYRNWLFGLYIVEFEQHGEDRAAYGQQLLIRLSENLRNRQIKGVSDRSLRIYRQFYLTYPEIWQSLTAKLESAGVMSTTKLPKVQLPSTSSEIPVIDIDKLLGQLTFTHFTELLRVEDSWQRRFYEIETVKNNWKIRELRRAINTLLYERTGLSKNKEAVIAKMKDNQKVDPNELIRNPYLLEFLGLNEKSEYSEDDLEKAIIDHLQDFLLEMGQGFCFEARQKRISFGNRHYRIDLVFYHRIIKCHVLIDLKIGDFDHADAGQMNVYLNYYKANEMSEGDNPPVGIILCASKDDTLVEYATSGLAQEIFVSRYLTQLPDKEQLRAFIRKETEIL